MKVQTRINKLAKVKFLVKFQMSSIVSTTSEVASFADFVNFEKALCPKELEANRRLSKPLVFVTATECLEKWKKCFSHATQMSILEGKKDVFAPLLCGDLRRMVAKLLSKKVDRVTEPEDPLDDDESTHWEIDLTSHSSDVVRRVTVGGAVGRGGWGSIFLGLGPNQHRVWRERSSGQLRGLLYS